MSAFTKFYFRPGEGELIETVVHLKPETHSSIHGSVRDSDGKSISNALVMLFKASDDEELTLHTQMCTDEFGQFFFGPLTVGQLYMIKIFKNTTKIRELQIRPE